MGISLSDNVTLTESQEKKRQMLGLSYEAMMKKILREQGKSEYLVSIIIPVYNGEKYIKQAIDSALSQEYNDLEIIVVDDGSTDKTHEILMKYDSINTVSKVNGGTASALNSGIKNSSGRWIKWLSADDVLRNNCISNMIGMVESVKDGENCIFYTHYDRIDQDGAMISRFQEHDRPESELWNYFYGNGSSSLIHRSVFDKVGMFDESLKHSEDYEFWLRATQVFGVRLHLLNTYSLLYRVHPDQLTNKVGGSLDSFIKNKIRGMINGKPITC